MGTPDIKYGDSVCYIQHVETCLWLTYQTVDAKSVRMGGVQRKVWYYTRIELYLTIDREKKWCTSWTIQITCKGNCLTLDEIKVLQCSLGNCRTAVVTFQTLPMTDKILKVVNICFTITIDVYDKIGLGKN